MLKFDPEKCREANATIAAAFNGEGQVILANIFKTCKESGEGNPIIEEPIKLLTNVQNTYNTDVVPAVKQVLANLQGFEEFSEFVNNLTAGNVNTAVDVGGLEAQSYDVGNSL